VDLGSLKSKKLVVTLLAAAAIVANDLAGKPVSDESMYTLLGILGTYILGQGVADAGSQGAATAVRRALVEGEGVAEAVVSVLKHRNGKGRGKGCEVHPEDEDGPSWSDTSEMDDEDKPRDLNG